MSSNLVTIEISDEKSLYEACDMLHDSRFDLSTLKLDEEKGIWEARFEREFFEDPKEMTHERKMFFFVKTTFPLAETELTLTGIKSYRIEDNSEIEIYTFNECQIKDRVATLVFCEDMKMVLEFYNKPIGKLADQKLLEKTGSKCNWCKRI
ncbi:MAG: hypothetical protein GY694_08220 [Gammaproteobacteria bacterium]|nr:hypothetical protein [Gammaproteobacteria bacterium]